MIYVLRNSRSKCIAKLSKIKKNYSLSDKFLLVCVTFIYIYIQLDVLKVTLYLKRLKYF